MVSSKDNRSAHIGESNDPDDVLRRMLNSPPAQKQTPRKKAKKTIKKKPAK